MSEPAPDETVRLTVTLEGVAADQSTVLMDAMNSAIGSTGVSCSSTTQSTPSPRWFQVYGVDLKDGATFGHLVEASREDEATGIAVQRAEQASQQPLATHIEEIP